MDPYEYLLSKLNVIIIREFTSYSIYIKLETGEKLVAYNIPPFWTHEYIFKYYKNIDSNHLYRQYDKNLDFFCRQLRQFPDNLESTEHVDLLLAVNGLNKEI